VTPPLASLVDGFGFVAPPVPASVGTLLVALLELSLGGVLDAMAGVVAGTAEVDAWLVAGLDWSGPTGAAGGEVLSVGALDGPGAGVVPLVVTPLVDAVVVALRAGLDSLLSCLASEQPAAPP
jgi:hypothetical protein